MLLHYTVSGEDIERLQSGLAAAPTHLEIYQARFKSLDDVNTTFRTICEGMPTAVVFMQTQIFSSFLPWLTATSNIDVVRFYECSCGEGAMVAFESELEALDFDEYGAIESVSLDDMRMSQADATSLARVFLRCSPVRFFSSGLRIDVGVLFDTPLLWCVRLREISLGDARLDDDGLVDLVDRLHELCILWNIEALSLCANSITDMSPVFPMIMYGKLERLDMSSNRISLCGDDTLAFAVERSTSIETLDLSWNSSIDDKDVSTFFRWPVLTHPSFMEFKADNTKASATRLARLARFTEYVPGNCLHQTVALIAATRFAPGRHSTPFPTVLCRLVCAWLWKESPTLKQ